MWIRDIYTFLMISLCKIKSTYWNSHKIPVKSSISVVLPTWYLESPNYVNDHLIRFDKNCLSARDFIGRELQQTPPLPPTPGRNTWTIKILLTIIWHFFSQSMLMAVDRKFEKWRLDNEIFAHTHFWNIFVNISYW